MGQPTDFPSVCAHVLWPEPGSGLVFVENVVRGLCIRCCLYFVSEQNVGKEGRFFDYWTSALYVKWARNSEQSGGMREGRNCESKKNEHRKVHLAVFDPGEWEELEIWRARGEGPWKCPYQLLLLGSRPHSCPQDHHHQNPTADPGPVEPSNLP